MSPRYPFFNAPINLLTRTFNGIFSYSSLAMMENQCCSANKS